MVDYVWIIALAGGFTVAWLMQQYRLKGSGGPTAEEREEASRQRAEEADSLARAEERSRGFEKSLGDARERVEALQRENTDLHSKLAAGNERLESQEKRLEEQKEELAGIQKKLTAEFENLANRILDEKGKKFALQNKESLDKLLSPLNERIKDFRERVDRTHEQGLKDRAALNEQLKNLHQLNLQMTEEAQNLTTALKGQSKAQGNWGEMILERVLEKSGLVAGQEYETQVSITDEEGRRFQPDVLIKLPEEKRLVVDSKVSLVAYERFVNEEDTEIQESHLREHLASLKTHVGDLSKKSYESLYGIRSPDFVLMFVPVEAAFTAAMQFDDSLFDHAFRQNVVIVTPSTLLATLRTVANIWRQEKQSKNVMEIARRSGALYDKFVGFYTDMEELGRRIGKSQEVYDAAVNKLKSGRGNLVKSVEDIKALGAKAKKSLPLDAVEDAALEE
ncbi:MAG: DNA recombination protein RmuC [Opitutales bacterium TMED158]|nr:MAG: DNA recombination protein RmuC [Opitutales bacterium TMED158]